nr:MAG TPA: hypothetical protein [Caudoviricetes sp.]
MRGLTFVKHYILLLRLPVAKRAAFSLIPH